MFWVEHRNISTSLLTNNVYYIETQRKFLRLFLLYENYAKGLFRYKQIYSIEYNISESNVSEYNHDALLTLIFTRCLQNVLIFSALGFVSLIHKGAKLNTTFIGLLPYCIISTVSQIITLIDLASYLIKIYINSGSVLHRLTATPLPSCPLYQGALHLF